MLVVGLAPGADGANRTGRPFVGDPSGDLLQAALAELGLAGRVRVTNAVRCLPPANRPTAAELRTCGEAWLAAELDPGGRPPTVLALGRLAHAAVLRTLGLRQAAWPFAHLACHPLPGRWLVDCYHPSPRNTRTGRLPPGDLAWAVARAAELDRSG